MTTKPLPDIPSDSEFLEIVNLDDYFSVAIKGHQCIDTVLSQLLSASLPDPHKIEIVRLSYGLKVDFATAMQLLQSDSRPSFTAINKLRNKFAHDPNTVFDINEAINLCNTLSIAQKQTLGQYTPSNVSLGEFLANAIAIVFVETQSALNQVLDQKIYQEVQNEMVQETLERGRRTLKNLDEHKVKREKEMRRRFLKKKSEKHRLAATINHAMTIGAQQAKERLGTKKRHRTRRSTED